MIKSPFLSLKDRKGKNNKNNLNKNYNNLKERKTITINEKLDFNNYKLLSSYNRYLNEKEKLDEKLLILNNYKSVDDIFYFCLITKNNKMRVGYKLKNYNDIYQFEEGFLFDCIIINLDKLETNKDYNYFNKYVIPELRNIKTFLYNKDVEIFVKTTLYNEKKYISKLNYIGINNVNNI